MKPLLAFIRVVGLILGSQLIWVQPLNGQDAPESIEIWPNQVPGETREIGPETVQPSRGDNITRITNVSRPTMQVFQPDADKRNGCAVVICPGGGYHILAYTHEGVEVAEWLRGIGVTAIVLKYRVPRRQEGEFQLGPLQDVQRTIRLVRSRAKELEIDPQRVGVLGFSAGGHLTMMAGTHWDQMLYPKQDQHDEISSRPDFLLPIYAAYLGDPKQRDGVSPKLRLTKDTPPTFLVVTQDDKTRGADAALLFAKLTRLGVAAEVHVFRQGGHGYGLRPSKNPVSKWPRLAEDWLRDSGWLEPTDR